jgi:hypothetical protein
MDADVISSLLDDEPDTYSLPDRAVSRIVDGMKPACRQ